MKGDRTAQASATSRRRSKYLWLICSQHWGSTSSSSRPGHRRDTRERNPADGHRVTVRVTGSPSGALGHRQGPRVTVRVPGSPSGSQGHRQGHRVTVRVTGSLSGSQGHRQGHRGQRQSPDARTEGQGAEHLRRHSATESERTEIRHVQRVILT